MGYVVLHIEKAAGTDAAMSGHVERIFFVFSKES